MSEPKKVSAPLRLSPELMAKVKLACEITGESQADILRIALGMGLEDLKRLNYDIHGTLSRAANSHPHVGILPHTAEGENRNTGTEGK